MKLLTVKGPHSKVENNMDLKEAAYQLAYAFNGSAEKDLVRIFKRSFRNSTEMSVVGGSVLRHISEKNLKMPRENSESFMLACEFINKFLNEHSAANHRMTISKTIFDLYAYERGLIKRDGVTDDDHRISGAKWLIKQG